MQERSPAIDAGRPTAELQHGADPIAEGFWGTFNRETVERALLDSVRSLADSTAQTYVPLLAERLTRERRQ